MGANQSNVPTGTKWSDIQKDRKKYQDVELPDIPYNKMKEVCVEIDNTVKDSKYIKEYKREIRDALKRKCAKGHSPKLFRLQDKCFHPADEAAGKGNTRKDMCKELCEGINLVIKDDVIDALKEEGKPASDKAAEQVIWRLVYERMIDQIMLHGERIFKKHQKGQSADESDPELSEEALQKEEEERLKRKRKAAEVRQQEADAWMEETGEGGGAKTKAVEDEMKKRAEDSDEEEEDDDEDEEDED